MVTTKETNTVLRMLDMQFGKSTLVEISSGIESKSLAFISVEYYYTSGKPEEEDSKGYLQGTISWESHLGGARQIQVHFRSDLKGMNVFFSGEFPAPVFYPFYSEGDAKRILGTVDEETFVPFLKALIERAVQTN